MHDGVQYHMLKHYTCTYALSNGRKLIKKKKKDFDESYIPFGNILIHDEMG
jgi:hypothetical protein